MRVTDEHCLEPYLLLVEVSNRQQFVDEFVAQLTNDGPDFPRQP